MRKLTFLITVAAVLYSGYWFVGSSTIEDGARQGLEDLRNAGWQVDYDDLSTVGFPSRFDTTVTALTLESPDAGLALTAPFVQVFALSYQPNKVIAVAPSDFAVTRYGIPFAVTDDRLRASAAVRPNTALELSDLTVEAHGVTVTSPDLGRLTLERGLAALRGVDDVPNTYDAYLDMSALAGGSRNDGLPSRVERFVFDARVVTDRPLDRHGFDGTGRWPSLRGIELRQMALDLPDMSVTASGTLTIDDLGIPDGRITLRTAEWRQLIDYLVAADVIDDGMRRTVRNVAQTLAAGGGELVLPVAFDNGFMSVGPLPLGPAPRFP